MSYTLYNKIIARDYNSKLSYPVFRTDKTERKKFKEADSLAREAWRKDEHRLLELFKIDLRKDIEFRIDKPITDEQFNAIFRMVWENGHSSGYSEVLSGTEDLIAVIKTFVRR